MRQRRKTKAERAEGEAALDRQKWDAFRPRLEALQTMEDAYNLVAEAPRPDSPGRRYYSNLGFFLQAFTPPMGSNYSEKQLYLQFVRRLDQTGKLKPVAMQQVEIALKQAMEQQGPW